MTLLMFEGWDLYSTTAGLAGAQMEQRGWNLNGFSSASVDGTGRTGGLALHCNNPAYGGRYWFPGDPARHATFIIGFAHSCSAGSQPGAEREIVRLYGDEQSTVHVSLTLASDLSLRVHRGNSAGTQIATTGPVVASWVDWHYIEFKVTLSDTVGTIDVRVDGVSVLSLTGQDTKNGGTNTVFDSFLFGNIASGSNNDFYDDFYICNGAGSVNNNFLGDCRVRAVVPSGNGATSAGLGSDGNSANNYQLVDDLQPRTSGTADYVDLQVTGDTDTYAMPDLSETGGPVYGVQVSTYDGKSDAGVRKIAHVLRVGGTDYAGSDIVEALGQFGWHKSMWETNPASSAQWTVADVNALEAGAKAR